MLKNIIAEILATLLSSSRHLNQHRVSQTQFLLLNHLFDNGRTSMTDVSKKMGHSTAAATGLVDRLEKLGYVIRVRKDGDRRKVYVELTQKGHELVEEIRSKLETEVAGLVPQPA